MIDELLVAAVLITAATMISVLSIEDSQQIRLLPLAAWIAVILLIPLFGPAAWFIAGRPRKARNRPGPGHPPQAPDDDPDFLQTLR